MASSFDPYAQCSPQVELWQLSDFKWLAASQGLVVDVRRLQRDQAYAADRLSRALSTSCEPLRESSRRLSALLCPILPG